MARTSRVVPGRQPTVGFGRQQLGIRVTSSSGAEFHEADLSIVGRRVKGASVFFNHVGDVRKADLRRWLKKAHAIP